MALQKIIKKRGGIEKELTIGIAEDGNCRLKEVVTQPRADGLKYKKRPKTITLEFGEEGELLSIFNEFLIRDLTPTGELVPDQVPKPFNFPTSESDKLIFVQKFKAILYSMVNGSNTAEGFPQLPVFYSDNVLGPDGQILHYAGQVIQYTEEQMNEPSTLDAQPEITEEPQP